MLSLIAREANLVFANLVDRRWEAELEAGDTIHVPSISNLATRTKTKASNAAITYETIYDFICGRLTRLELCPV